MERNSIDQKAARKPSGAAVIRPDLTDALFRALFEEWAQTGYAAISLERVATRAGAGKAAIYRRWSSKREFATEAIERAAPMLGEFGDHGSLEADILAYLTMNRRVLRHPLVRRILPDLHAERMRSGDLAGLLDHVATARRTLGQDMLDRAIARGELRGDIDREFAFDLIPSPLYWRMIVRCRPIGMAALQRQAKIIAAALRSC